MHHKVYIPISVLPYGDKMKIIKPQATCDRCGKKGIVNDMVWAKFDTSPYIRSYHKECWSIEFNL